jgi:putative ABC transport system permease protein
MGARFSRLYQDYFRFPSIPSVIDWGAVGVGVGVSGGFALLGALSGVRRVMRLTPAEALRPEAPSRFRRLTLEALGLGRFLSPAVRMVLRNVERRPVRTASTAVGVALAVALLASGRFPYDALDRLMEVEFHLAQRYDALAVFTQATPAAAALELRHVDGVLAAEPFRATSIRVKRGTAMRSTTITGIGPGRLYRLVDADGREFDPPPAGCVITRWLAQYLGVAVGDTIAVDLLEQGGRRVGLVVAGTYDPMVGNGIYMSRAALNRLLREPELASGSYLSIAPRRESDVMSQLKAFPGIAGVVSRRATIRSMNDQMRQSMVFVLALIITSACVIALGVVYNSARIALSERGRELASLRVLGFTTGEVSRMLLGEQGAVVLLALPLGIAFGAAFSFALVLGFKTERFQFPFVVAFRSQLLAVGVVVAAAALAGLIVHRRVGRLDMVAALRTRE